MAKPRIFYDNRFADGTPVASSTAAGDFNVLNLIAFRGYRFFKFASLPGTVTIDCGVARPADSLFVWGHDLSSNACTIEVHGSTDNFAASNVVVDTHTPASDRPFARTWTSVSYRYWRALISGGIAPKVAILAVGQKLELPGILTFDSFDPLARRVYGVTHANELGQPMGKILDFHASEQAVALRGLTWAWLRDTWVPAWNLHLATEPVGWQWNAGLDVEPLLAQIGDAMETPHQANGLAGLSFTIDAVRPQ